MRIKRNESVIVDNPGHVLDYLEDPTITISQIDELNPETWMISFTTNDEYLVENDCSNLAISLFTTSYARYDLGHVVV